MLKDKIGKLKAILFLIIILIITPGIALGELYRWVDKDGVVHFDETRPEEADSAVKVESVPREGTGKQVVQEPGVESKDMGAATETAPDSPTDSGTEPDSKVEPEKAPAGEAKPEQTPAQEVELYVTSWCVYCKMAADFLEAKGIPFRSYDIERDREAALRRMRLDPSPGVPFAVINGFRIRGFSVEAYEEALAHNKKTAN